MVHLILRKAVASDVPQIVALVNEFASRGEVLPRTPEEVRASLSLWVVAEEDGHILACGSLLFWGSLAEVRSLVVRSDRQGNGLGSQIVLRLIEEARKLEASSVFALTRAVAFFERLGFHVAPREAFPDKIWHDCLQCPRFLNCDETAVMLPLAPAFSLRLPVRVEVGR